MLKWTSQFWSWSSNTSATWCKELSHWQRPRCWQRLKAGGEGDNRGWDGWMASPTQCTWVWVNSGRWWRTGRPGVLQSVGSQMTEQLNNDIIHFCLYIPLSKRSCVSRLLGSQQASCKSYWAFPGPPRKRKSSVGRILRWPLWLPPPGTHTFVWFSPLEYVHVSRGTSDVLLTRRAWKKWRDVTEVP